MRLSSITIRSFIVALIAFVLATGFVFADDQTGAISGEVNDTISWELNENGVLTISGVGPMNDYETNTDCPWSDHSSEISSVVIGDGITHIGDYSFYYCRSLEEVDFGATVESIGKAAFATTNLTSVILQDSVTSIGPSAFDRCQLIKSVEIPGSVEIIGENAFADCRFLRTITVPGSVKEVSYGAFCGCQNLMSVTLMEGVTSIGGMAFLNCNNLVNIDIPDTLTYIGDDAFSNCENLTSITIPEGMISIGEYAFNWCKSLTSITIPNSVQSIGMGAFQYCNNLTSVSVPFTGENGTDSGNGYFGYIFGVEDYTKDGIIPYSIKEVTITGRNHKIPDNAFRGCTMLTSITIPDGVTEIGEGAFMDCTALESFTIPYGVTTISNNAFKDCTHMTNIAIPDSVEVIGDNAFQFCMELTGVDIPVSATSINSHVFEGCSNLERITIPESVTQIMDCAFKHCSKLESVTIPKSVSYISDDAFAECDNTKFIVSDNSAGHDFVVSNKLKYDLDTGHTIVIDEARASNCTVYGLTEGQHCMTCGEVLVEQQSLPLNGVHDWYTPEFIVNEADGTVTATRYCKHNKRHSETETAAITAEVTKPATYTEMGETTYTVVFTNPAFGTQIKTVADIPKLEKLNNPMTAKGKIATVKYKKLKKKTQTVAVTKAFAVSKAQGKVTYKVATYDKKAKKKITVNSAGKVTVKKGLKKGTYKVKVKVTAAGNTQYKAATKTVTVTIKVK